MIDLSRITAYIVLQPLNQHISINLISSHSKIIIQAMPPFLSSQHSFIHGRWKGWWTWLPPWRTTKANNLFSTTIPSRNPTIPHISLVTTQITIHIFKLCQITRCRRPILHFFPTIWTHRSLPPMMNTHTLTSAPTPTPASTPPGTRFPVVIPSATLPGPSIILMPPVPLPFPFPISIPLPIPIPPSFSFPISVRIISVRQIAALGTMSGRGSAGRIVVRRERWEGAADRGGVACGRAMWGPLTEGNRKCGFDRWRPTRHVIGPTGWLAGHPAMFGGEF